MRSVNGYETPRRTGFVHIFQLDRTESGAPVVYSNNSFIVRMIIVAPWRLSSSTDTTLQKMSCYRCPMNSYHPHRRT